MKESVPAAEKDQGKQNDNKDAWFLIQDLQKAMKHDFRMMWEIWSRGVGVIREPLHDVFK